MIHLNYTIANEIDEYQTVISTKHLVSRGILTALIPRISIDYNLYIDDFDTIANLGPNPYDLIESDELRKCYVNSTASLESLKAKLINSQDENLKFLCPYCLITNHSTFDHYIPKEDFPVYSILSKNLIQSCDPCNKKKLTYWRENNQRAIIHYYYDIDINAHKYLYSILDYSTGIPTFDFYLDFNDDISLQKQFTITSHFNRLNLLSRYTLNAPSVISDINVDVKTQAELGLINREIIKALLTIKSNQLKVLYGINYWRAIVMDILASSNQFLESLVD